MPDPEKNLLYYGRKEDLPPQVPLRAGPLSMIFHDGDLRYICWNGKEIIRRIYAAVRDRNWGTIPGTISDLVTTVKGESFAVSFKCRHEQGEIGFEWCGIVTGDPTGRITFGFDGVAHSTFLRNRIGICVLHPASECSGVRCNVTHDNGSEEPGRFPQFISPHQPFLDIRSFSNEVAEGAWAKLHFEGDVFEMEDQRNWLDASFKTYSTPLSIPFPAEIERGTRVRQSVALELENCRSHELVSLPVPDAPVRVTIQRQATPLPRLGLQNALSAPSEKQLDLLRALNLSHLRVDLRMNADWMNTLRGAEHVASQLDVPLELALFFSSEYEPAWHGQVRLPVARLLVHHVGTNVSPPSLLRQARDHLQGINNPIPIAAGTDAFFTELNRNRPDPSLLDFICYSVNPQVHASDNLSIVENAATLSATVQSARRFVGNIPIAITPVTLRARSKTAVTPGQLPTDADVRQMSLFGAAWTLASFKYLAESAVAAATYYETIGWRGVMEAESGSPEPTLFPSAAGGVFPLYHALADIGEFRNACAIHSTSSDALRVEVLALRSGDATRIMLANMTCENQTALLEGVAQDMHLRLLDETTVVSAIQRPVEFRAASPSIVRPSNGTIRLMLKPYALATLTMRPLP